MDRRKSLKALVVGTVSTGILVDACKNPDTKPSEPKTDAGTPADRMAEEIAHEDVLGNKKFFDAHEMATLAVLTDIIIPADEISGSASEAEVPAFIDFMAKDRPQYQIPLRGGLRWLDVQCLNLFGKTFRDGSSAQQIEIIDQIAYPKKVKPELRQGASFFTLMRNLTISGFYTSRIGVKDIGYV